MLRSLAGVGAFCMILCAPVVCVVEQLPSFEVASLRLAPRSRASSRTTEARVDIGQPLQAVVLWAFRVAEYQLIAPDWLSQVFVEIHATMPSGTTVDQVPDMLRRLLVERFAIVVHSEQRSIDGYQLSIGAGGIKMPEVDAVDEFNKRSEPQLTSSGRPRSDRVMDTPAGPVRWVEIAGGTRWITSRTMYERTVTRSGSIINATRMTMAELVPFLALNLDAPVIDKTGLAGIYQFKIELPQDATANRLFAQLGERVDTTPQTISASRAVESLGLKLERRRTSAEVVVIDAMKRTPSEN